MSVEAIRVLLDELNSRQLIEVYGEVIDKIRQRPYYIGIARNGNIFLKRCPDCDCLIVGTRFTFNGTQRDIDAILSAPDLGNNPHDRWIKYHILEHSDLPDSDINFIHVPPAKPGSWFVFSCGCKHGDWKPTYDEAMASYMEMPIYKIGDAITGGEKPHEQ